MVFQILQTDDCPHSKERLDFVFKVGVLCLSKEKLSGALRMTNVNEFFFLSLLQDFIDKNRLVILYEMVDVKLPVVWKMGVFI